MAYKVYNAGRYKGTVVSGGNEYVLKPGETLEITSKPSAMTKDIVLIKDEVFKSAVNDSLKLGRKGNKEPSPVDEISMEG